QILRRISSATCVLLSGTQISRGADMGTPLLIGGLIWFETPSASKSSFHTSAAYPFFTSINLDHMLDPGLPVVGRRSSVGIRRMPLTRDHHRSTSISSMFTVSRCR